MTGPQVNAGFDQPCIVPGRRFAKNLHILVHSRLGQRVLKLLSSLTLNRGSQRDVVYLG
jgi:hypothetical protein